jgi:hypothetical protein
MSEYDYRDRQETNVTVFSAEKYDNDWPWSDGVPTLIEVIRWLQDKLNEVPEEYRAVTHCEIDSVSSWESSHYAQITIEYRRPETDLEMSNRIASVEAVQARELIREREKYEMLRAKFENKE